MLAKRLTMAFSGLLMLSSCSIALSSEPAFDIDDSVSLYCSCDSLVDFIVDPNCLSDPNDPNYTPAEPVDPNTIPTIVEQAYSTYSIDCDGVDDYLSIPDYKGITGTAARTISAWVKPDVSDKGQAIVGWGTPEAGKYIGLLLNDDNRIRLSCYGSEIFSHDFFPFDGKWHNVTAVIQADSTLHASKLYLDGVEVELDYSTTDVVINTQALNNVQIGSFQPIGDGYYFDGLIDEVIILSKALNSEEVANMYDYEMVHLPFNMSASDITVHNFDGTLYGNVSFSNETGANDGAVEFDGDGDYVVLDGYKGVTGSSAKSISVWVKPDVPADPNELDKMQGIVGWGVGENGNFAAILLDSSRKIQFSCWGDEVHSLDVFPFDGKWHNIVLVIDENSSINDVKLYLDGDLLSLSTSSLNLDIETLAGRDVQIGSFYPTGDGYYYDGMMDELVIYNYALSYFEVCDLQSSLDFYYDCDELGSLISSVPSWARPTIVENGYMDGALDCDGINDYLVIPGYKGVTGTEARTISAWVKPDVSGKSQAIAGWGTLGVGTYVGLLLNDDNRIRLSCFGSEIYSHDSFPFDGQWHNVTAVVKANSTLHESKIYLDGVEVALDYSSTDEAVNTGSDIDVQIGSFKPAGDGYYFDGLIDEVKIYSQSLNPYQVADMYDYEIVHLTFDSSAEDVTAHNFNGTLIGDVAFASDTGIIDGAVMFDGAGDYITIDGYKGVTGTSARSISVWVKPDVPLDPNDLDRMQGIVGWGSDASGCFTALLIDSNQKIQFSCWGAEVSSNEAFPFDGKWHNITAVLDSASSINDVKIYLDARLLDMTLTGPDLLVNTEAGRDVQIGSFYPTGDGYYYSGQMDDLHIYNYAISSEKISSFFDSNLEMYFSFDFESLEVNRFNGLSANNYYAEIVLDPNAIIDPNCLEDPNDPNSPLDPNAVYYSLVNENGYLNDAVDLNGTGDYLTVPGYKGISGNAARTISAWVRPDVSGKGQAIVGWGTPEAGEYIGLLLNDDNRIRLSCFGSEIRSQESFPFDGQWHNIAAVIRAGATLHECRLYLDGVEVALDYSQTDIAINTVSAGDVQIGSFNPIDDGYYFSGLIDEVKIYSQSLNPYQIAAMYDYEMVHFAFDDLYGSVAVDSTSHGFDGTLHGDAEFLPNSGVVGGAISFDGAGDYVTVDSYKGVTGSTAKSLSVWVKPDVPEDPNDLDRMQGLVGWGADESESFVALLLDSNQEIQFSCWGDKVNTHTKFPFDGQWHLITVVIEEDSTTNDVKIYLDATKLIVMPSSLGLSINTLPGRDVQIGSFYPTGDGYYYDGLMDELSVFDYALSSTDIYNLYNSVE